MANEEEAIFVDDTTSDESDDAVLPVSNVKFYQHQRNDTPIEIHSDDNDEYDVIYQDPMQATLARLAEKACRQNSKRRWSERASRATSPPSSRTNGYTKKRQKPSSSTAAKKKTMFETKSVSRNHSTNTYLSSDDDSVRERLLVPKTLRSISPKLRPNTRSRKPELSKSNLAQSSGKESPVRCPLCWFHFSSDIIEDHIDQCGKPQTSRRNTRIVTSIPGEKINGNSSDPGDKQCDHFTSSDEEKKPTSKPSKRKATKPLRAALSSDEELEEDRKLPARSHAKESEDKKEYPKALREQVEAALRQARQAQLATRQDRLEKMIMAKNELLQNGQPRRQQPLPNYRRLPYVESQTLDSTYLRHQDHPIPTDSHHTIFIRKHFSSLGTEKEDEDDNDNKAPPSPCVSPASDVESVGELEVFELPPSEQQYAEQIAEFYTVRIAVYEEDEIDQEIEEVLKRLKHSRHNRQRIHEYLAILLQVDKQRVTKIWEKANGVGEPRRQHATQYEEVMSSFRDLFCRRCLIFDCNLHGLQDDYPPDVQLELAVRLENSGFWKNESSEAIDMCLPVGSDFHLAQDRPELESHDQEITEVPRSTPLSLEDQELCKRLYQVFQNDLKKVAQVTSIPQDTIRQQVDLVPFEFKLSDPLSSHQVKSKQTKSNSYHPEWIKRIVQATSHPFFNPCTHKEPCSNETCSCIKNRFFCTKACIWGTSSRNFFRGCNCTSKCNAKSCPCFASNRECDPDLCRRCGACTDPPNQAANEQSCRNDNVGMRRHVHLLLGKSRIAGWGLYTKDALKKGDYVHEYLGELIPQNEAERRGKIYDDRNQTYIFDMSTDYAVDALQKGNKTRFINHSDNPNIGPQMKIVNGDYRIGFFALKDIPAQSELFFDYGDKFFKATGGFMLQNSSKKKV